MGMIFILAFIIAAVMAGSSIIQELDVKTLEPMFRMERPILITFYAGWCKHSTLFKEAFAEIAAEAKAKYPDMLFAQFDCGRSVEHRDLCYRFEAYNYPGLM